MTTPPRVAVVKIGGSIATIDRPPDFVHRELLRRLGRAFAEARVPLVLVHGTGRVGKPWAHRGGFALTGKLPREARDVALRIRSELRELNAGVVAALTAGGLVASGFEYESISNLDRDDARERLLAALERGVTPTFFGDMLETADGGHQVVSSDVMIEHVAGLLDARVALFLTDVAGVFGGSPENLLSVVSPGSIDQVSRRGSDDLDVSAGMRGKLACAFRVAARVERCFIASGLDESIAARLLAGHEAVATRVFAEP